MADLSSLAGTWQSVLQYGIWGLVAIIGLAIFMLIGGIFGWFQWQKKKWYLTVVLKMPRDNGKTIVAEVAKGYWDSRKATLWVKRHGTFGSKFYTKLDDIRKYLQGSETVELIGSGTDWKPILFESYLDVIDEQTNQEASVMSYIMNFSTDKAWAIAAERDYVNTFSISDLFNKLKDYIGWGLVIFIVILAEVIKGVYLSS